MKFNELILKYKTDLKKEYVEFTNLGPIDIEKDLRDNHIGNYKLIGLVFKRTTIFHKRIKTLEDLKNIHVEIKNKIKSDNVPYHSLLIRLSNDSVTVDAKALMTEYQFEKVLDFEKNKYNFREEFREIMRVETSNKYIPMIDCSVLKMYRDNIITFNQLQKALKSC